MNTEALVDKVCDEVINAIRRQAGGKPSIFCPAADSELCLICGKCVTRVPAAVNKIISEGACRISSQPGIGKVDTSIAGMIDHTLLKAEATEDQIRELCREAAEYRFASVCINPGWVELSARLLRRTGVKVCTVIGFPLGATTSETKAYETRDTIGKGAAEVDMVINIGAAKSGDWSRVKKDIQGVVRASRPNVVVKVILETSLLTDEEKVRACEMSREAGADFVKTSTGFSTGGATAADIALMRKAVGPKMGIKASGGVRDLETAREMVKAGATRIGASASIKIVQGASSSPGDPASKY